MKKFIKIIIYLITIITVVLLCLYTMALLIPMDVSSTRKSITIYDRYGKVMYESNFSKTSNWVTYDDIPKSIINIYTTIEDKRFFSHYGIDPIRLTKASISNITNGKIVEGGSTITQQYAKNIYLSNDQTMSRKISEIYLAISLEMHYSKKEILEGYLNTLYFGHGIYGISNASNFFFNKPLNKLNIKEIAMLVGIPNGPSIYSPFINKNKAEERCNLILSILNNNKIINDEAYKSIADKPLEYSSKKYDNNHMYYVDSVLNELKELGYSGYDNISIYTYYDPNVQSNLSDAISSFISEKSELQVSSIIVEPYTSNILAIQGGKNYANSQYNRVYNSKRQAGSTIKPLLYYCALSQGFTPSSKFLSSATTFQLDNGKSYDVANHNNLHPNSEISMINAISLSDNIYAIKTHLFLGEEVLDSALRSFDIDNSKPIVSLPLGTIEMSTYELSKIYNTFASEGIYNKPSTIKSIFNSDHKKIYERKLSNEQLLFKDETLILSELLTSTFDINNQTVSYPTMYGYKPNVKLAAKSGTTDFDALVTAYNPKYTFVLWSGYDDNSTLTKEDQSRGKFIMKQFYNSLNNDNSYSWYYPSNNLTYKYVNSITGAESSNGIPYLYKLEEPQ